MWEGAKGGRMEEGKREGREERRREKGREGKRQKLYTVKIQCRIGSRYY